MNRRNLGSEGLEVSELGLGCMGMSEFYGTGDENESIGTIHLALELGIERKYLEENAAAAGIELTDEDLRSIEVAAPVGAASGERYDETSMRSVNR